MSSHKCSRCQHKSHKCKKRCKKSCIPVSRDSFGCKHDKTYRICKSGKYCLVENVSFKPGPYKTDAIVIDADDVVLDLCGFELRQGNEVTFCTGIRVKTGHKNVTILGSNGAVRRFSQLGIYVEGGTKDITIGDTDTSLNINDCAKADPDPLTDFSAASKDPSTGELQSCFKGGIMIGETTWWEITSKYGVGNPTCVPPLVENPNPNYKYNGPFENVALYNVKIERNQSSRICILGNGDQFKMVGCSLSHNFETRKYGPFVLPGQTSLDWPNFVSCQVIVYSGSQVVPRNGESPKCKTHDSLNNVLIDNTDVSFNKSESTDPDVNAFQVNIAGLIMGQHLTGMRIINSKFNKNEALCTYQGPFCRVQGCAPFGCFNLEVLSSEFSGNKCDSVTNTFCEGLHVSGVIPDPVGPGSTLVGSVGVKIKNCVASNNLSTGGNTGSTVGLVRGFSLFYIDGCSFVENISTENLALTTHEDGRAFSNGVTIDNGDLRSQPEGGTKNIQIIDCEICQNYTNADRGGGTGIFINYEGREIVIRDNVISENSFVEDRKSRTDIGINLRSRFFAEFGNDQYIEITDNTITFQNVGVQYDGSSSGITSGNKINRCEVGLLLGDANENVIENNTINKCELGLLLEDANKNVIENNRISNSDNTAIACNGTSECNVIRGNLLSNNVNGIFSTTVMPFTSDTNLIVENKVFNTTGNSYPVYILEGDSKSTGSTVLFPPTTGTLCVNTDFTKPV